VSARPAVDKAARRRLIKEAKEAARNPDNLHDGFTMGARDMGRFKQPKNL